MLCYHAYKINSDWVIILTYLAEALLDWRVPFKEEWISKKDGILHKGNLTCFRNRNLNTYLVMQKKCGDLSEKAIKILNDSSLTNSIQRNDFIRMTQSKSSTETINSGLKKCVSDGWVNSKDIVRDYRETLEMCSAQEGFVIEEELRAKLEGVLNRPERSYLSIKTVCIAVSVLGIIAVGGRLLSSQIAKKKLDKGRVRMQLIV